MVGLYLWQALIAAVLGDRLAVGVDDEVVNREFVQEARPILLLDKHLLDYTIREERCA